MRTDFVLRSVLVFGLLAAAGLGGAIAAAVALSGHDNVATQLPYAVSGGMGGLSVLGFCLAIATIQLGRRDAVAERRVIEGALRESADWLASVRAGAGK